jgi:hypothetical protein
VLEHLVDGEGQRMMISCHPKRQGTVAAQNADAPLAVQRPKARNRIPTTGFALLFVLWLSGSIASALDSFTKLKADEQIVLYPTFGQRVPGKDLWRIHIHGCVYELEKEDPTPAAWRKMLDLTDIEVSPADQRILDDRARLSNAHGHFTGEVLLGCRTAAS